MHTLPYRPSTTFDHTSIRLLLGFNLPTEPTFGLILVGDCYLLESLRLRHHRALYTRLGGHATLEPWSLDQAQEYLQKALGAVGLSPRVLESTAAELLAKASGGLPRSLQLLARAAWLAAAQTGKSTIAAEHVEVAVSQVPCVPGRERSLGPPSMDQS